jgi:hypothetical protein
MRTGRPDKVPAREDGIEANDAGGFWIRFVDRPGIPSAAFGAEEIVS